MKAEKKKAIPVVVRRDGDGEQLSFPSFSFSDSQNSTDIQAAQGLISSLLPSGAKRAVSLRRLADITNLSTREVRRAIQRQRLDGMPICEHGSGYFLAETEAERARWVSSMRSRAREILRVARAVENGGGSNGGTPHVFKDSR